MSKNDFETKSLILIILVAYILNLVFSITGYLCREDPAQQMLHYQIGNAFAISASVMAARYLGLRGQHVASSSYVLLGITHGISLAALGRASINVDREVTMVIPMIPALIFILWCDIYPRWLRIISLVPITFFTMVYIHVQSGASYVGLHLSLGYVSLQIIEVLWAIYIYKDWKQNSP